MISIILNCFSIGTQVSSLWKAFCCRSQPDHSGDLQDQLLVIRQHIGADELYDLHQLRLLLEQVGHLVAAGDELRPHVLVVPEPEIVGVLRVGGQPVDGGEVAGIGQARSRPQKVRT